MHGMYIAYLGTVVTNVTVVSNVRVVTNVTVGTVVTSDSSD